MNEHYQRFKRLNEADASTRFHKEYQQRIKDKWGIDRLTLENQPSTYAETFEDLWQKDEEQRMKNHFLFFQALGKAKAPSRLGLIVRFK
jgi:hypothetical protein